MKKQVAVALVALFYPYLNFKVKMVNCSLVYKCTIYEALAGRNPELPIEVEI